ncbi:hypothetical protein DLK05_08255 [Ancylomarina longa]|uniref:Uncharacterized protein n=2 Tax=Ancylomarina longa TaxID=2487017 RepID=A0A434AVS9_9BACT|nr:hypothetical protein DLK05_08255 [Ancylomarina longa]
MEKRKNHSEIQTLESYRVALSNAEAQSDIATTMATYGYTPEVIGEGKKLLADTMNVYNFNKQENNEARASRAEFDAKSSAINNTYSKHRKLARVIFRNDELSLQKLALKGRTPCAYINWLTTTKTFYSEIIADENVQSKLARFKFTKEEAESSLASIADLEACRLTYLREIGESQEATRVKDNTFAELDHWMQDFYTVAKIAMEEKPQLLEAIGILVRS